MGSRLEQHQKKRYQTSIILIIVALVAILYFIFTMGIRLVLSVSTFVASFNSKKNDTQATKQEQQYGLISIDSIPSATNSAKLYVGGSVVNFNQVLFYINGDQVKEVNLSSSDTFNEEIGDLKSGNNEIFVKGKQDNSSSEKKTKIYDVLYKSDKPKLEIKEPADGSKTNKSDITIKGVTDKETYIRINDLPVVVDSQGNFQLMVSLKDGDNVVSISAEDVSGNIENKTLKITYQKD